MGACDKTNDPDCDGFYDTIPGTYARGSDNCPGVYNPAQLSGPANADGVVDGGPVDDPDGDGIPTY